MSVKNTLQEHFQKYHLTLPIYNTTRVGGEDHLPNWISYVTIADGKIFTSRLCSSKKEAELDAASKAYKEIQEMFTSKVESKYEFDFSTYRIVILIDVENQPYALRELVEKTQSTGIEFYAFHSKGHPFAQKLSESLCSKDDRVKIIVVPSTRTDGADVGMLISIGAMLETSDFAFYIIISNDHFAEAAADVIQNYHKMYNIEHEKKAIACRNWKDAIIQLETLQSKE